MKGRRSIRIVVGLVLALGARTAVAAPHQLTEEIRAVTHCASHTGRPVSVPESRECCKVSGLAGAPATLAAVPTTLPPALVIAPAVPVLHGSTRAVAPVLARRRGERDGPPLYLGLSVLRR